MNKLFLVVLLAVCLVSAQAFVKRDAPANDNKNYVDDIQKKFQEFNDDLGNKLKEALDPDTIKKNFNKLVDEVNKALENVKPKQ